MLVRGRSPRRWRAGGAVAGLLLTLVVAAGCGGSSSDTSSTPSTDATPKAASGLKGSVTIGAVMPLTGGSASLGKDQQRGAELAADAVNADGGVLGKKLKIDAEDTETTPVAAVQAARKLVSIDKVPVVVGEVISADTIAAGKYLQKVGTPLVNPGSSSPDVAKIGDMIFSSIALDNVMGTFTAKTLYDAGYRKIATLAPNNAYGTGIMNAVQAEFKRLGGQIATSVLYSDGQSSYQTELNRLKDSGAQMYVYTSYEPDSLTILKDAFQLDLDPARFFGIYLSASATGDGAKAAAGQYGSDLKSGQGTPFASAYQAKYGEPVQTPYSPLVYDAVMMAAKAINEAGSTDPKAVQAALVKVGKDFPGVTGKIQLDANHQRKSQDYALLTVDKDGTLKPVSKIPAPSGS